MTWNTLKHFVDSIGAAESDDNSLWIRNDERHPSRYTLSFDQLLMEKYD